MRWIYRKIAVTIIDLDSTSPPAPPFLPVGGEVVNLRSSRREVSCSNPGDFWMIFCRSSSDLKSPRCCPFTLSYDCDLEKVTHRGIARSLDKCTTKNECSRPRRLGPNRPTSIAMHSVEVKEKKTTATWTTTMSWTLELVCGNTVRENEGPAKLFLALW